MLVTLAAVYKAIDMIITAWEFYGEVNTADIDIENHAATLNWMTLRVAGWRGALGRDALNDLAEAEQEMLLGCLGRIRLQIQSLGNMLRERLAGLQNQQAGVASRFVEGVMWTTEERDAAKGRLDRITAEVELADKFFTGR